jgi:acyl-CoA thioesterase II
MRRDMSYDVGDLLELLDLEPIEYNIYRGRNRDIGTGRVFGGQVMAQALVAARRTVDEDRDAHSLHGYFILPGDLAAPIIYFVDRLRDGSSFATRRVTAIQHGRAVFNMSASFHRREDGLEHQADMPAAPPPEGLLSELELIRRGADRIPEDVRPILTQDRPIDIRPVDADPFDDAAARSPQTVAAGRRQHARRDAGPPGGPRLRLRLRPPRRRRPAARPAHPRPAPAGRHAGPRHLVPPALPH